MQLTPQGQLALGTQNPHSSAVLHIASTRGGVLLPRMTTSEISAITSPAKGLIVYNKDINAFMYYDSNLTWRRMFTESDFLSTPAGGITQQDTTNWNTAFGWGNHTDSNYLTTANFDLEIQNFLSLDSFANHPVSEITDVNINNWDTAFSWGDHEVENYLKTADFDLEIQNFLSLDSFANHPVSEITGININNWDTAFSWGNHADSNYLRTADFELTPAGSITQADINRWDETNEALWLRNGNKTYLKNQSDKVGFGTTSPKANLHIYKNGKAPTTNIKLENRTGGGNPILNDGQSKTWELLNRNEKFYLSYYETENVAQSKNAKFTFTNDGYLGIGTTNPSVKLDVLGNSIDWITNIENLNEIGSGLKVKAGDQSSDGTIMQLENTNSEIQMVVKSNGNVGIGVENPQEKLSINGTTRTNNYDILFEQTGSNSGIGWYGSEEKTFAGTQIDGTILYGKTEGSLGLKNQDSENIIMYWTKDNPREQGEPLIGIGTQLPDEVLHIYASQPTIKLETFYGKGQPAIEFSDGGKSASIFYSLSEDIVIKNGATGNVLIDNYKNLQLADEKNFIGWYGKDGTGTAKTFAGYPTINGPVISGEDGGLLGIKNDIKEYPALSWKFEEDGDNEGSDALRVVVGSPDFDANFYVNGEIWSKYYKAENRSWADYVFYDDYNLRPLSEVEEFIAENKHLPEIPSEEEAVENGHDLAEMDRLLLMKIEELTLYIIDLNKTIEQQQKEIEQLKNKK